MSGSSGEVAWGAFLHAAIILERALHVHTYSSSTAILPFELAADSEKGTRDFERQDYNRDLVTHAAIHHMRRQLSS